MDAPSRSFPCSAPQGLFRRTHRPRFLEPDSDSSRLCLFICNCEIITSCCRLWESRKDGAGSCRRFTARRLKKRCLLPKQSVYIKLVPSQILDSFLIFSYEKIYQTQHHPTFSLNGFSETDTIIPLWLACQSQPLQN